MALAYIQITTQLAHPEMVDRVAVEMVNFLRAIAKMVLIIPVVAVVVLEKEIPPLEATVVLVL